MKAEQTQPVPVSRPDPGPGEAEEWRKDAGAVQLGEGEDSPVSWGIQNKRHKVGRLSGEGSLDGREKGGVGGEEITAALQGAG